MSSLIYYRFKSVLKAESIPFEGSSISAKDLKNAIRLKHGMISNDLDLIFSDGAGNDLDENKLISNYSTITVRRMPVVNKKPLNKTINPENFTRNDPYRLMRNNTAEQSLTSVNLATSDMTEDAKQDFVAALGAKTYPPNRRLNNGPIPFNYLCNKCNVSGHWISDCPGIPDKNGKLLDSRSVKRPSGIPNTNLTEVDANTPNSYLTTDGRYVVNIKNQAAYLNGKKDKRPFSKEENPPMLVEIEDKPHGLICEICKEILNDPVNTPCCKIPFCKKCALDNIFDEEKVTFHRCPNCKYPVNKLDSLTENSKLGLLVCLWRTKKINKEDFEREMTKITDLKEHTVSISKIVDDDDFTDDIFGFSNKENEQSDKLMLIDDNYVYAKDEKIHDVEVVSKEEEYEHTRQSIPVLNVKRGSERGYRSRPEDRDRGRDYGRRRRSRSRSGDRVDKYIRRVDTAKLDQRRKSRSRSRNGDAVKTVKRRKSRSRSRNGDAVKTEKRRKSRSRSRNGDAAKIGRRRTSRSSSRNIVATVECSNKSNSKSRYRKEKMNDNFNTREEPDVKHSKVYNSDKRKDVLEKTKRSKKSRSKSILREKCSLKNQKEHIKEEHLIEDFLVKTDNNQIRKEQNDEKRLRCKDNLKHSKDVEISKPSEIVSEDRKIKTKRSDKDEPKESIASKFFRTRSQSYKTKSRSRSKDRRRKHTKDRKRKSDVDDKEAIKEKKNRSSSPKLNKEDDKKKSDTSNPNNQERRPDDSHKKHKKSKKHGTKVKGSKKSKKNKHRSKHD